MKRILSVFVLIFAIALFPHSDIARSQDDSYALILQDCALYSDSECTQKLCSLPETYFVTIIEENESSYRVGFCDLVGYVPSLAVSKVDYTPKSKYPTTNTSKAYNDGNTVTLRSSPDHTLSNTVAKLSDGETVTYYGTIEGSSQISQLGSLWYYVRTNGDEPVYGYVYNLYFSPSPLPQNDTSPVDEPVSGQISSELNLAENGKYIVIVALCIPVIILMYIIFKGAKKSTDA